MKASRSKMIASRALWVVPGVLMLGGLLGAMPMQSHMLKGDMEVPPVQTTATATSTIEVHADMSVTGAVDTMGIAGTMAHIHMAPAGMNGPVVVTLEKSGDNRWLVPAGTKLTPEQYAAYKAGGLYVNVHSAAHKGGEIRMQLTG